MSDCLNYNPSELMVCAAAAEIKDGEAIFAGIGLPMLGALVAKFSHAPASIFAMEAGSLGPKPYRLPMSVADNASVERAVYVTSMWRIFSDQQAGCFDLGMLGGAQVDKYGNLNSTCIFGESGDYYTPATRLPGSGGANDIACCAKRTVITIPLKKQKFVEKVDFITSPGFLSGKAEREKYGFPGEGPCAIITNKCIFRFHPETGEAYLDTLFPGVTVEEVKENVGWDLDVTSFEIKTMEMPSQEKLELIRKLDPRNLFIGGGFSTLTFDTYIDMLEESLELFPKLFADAEH